MEATTLGPDLPLELLPQILKHLIKVHYLTNTALVSRTFYQSTVPVLYARASIYSWHRDAKLKVIQLFRTLSSCSHLARYVYRLEIRDFPKTSLPGDDHLVDSISKGLRNCFNLRSCTWTRDGSLTSDIFLALSTPSIPAPSDAQSKLLTATPIHALRELEINGHHSNLYDPKLLLQFRWLEKISIIMPTVQVAQVLEEWVQVVQESLKSLNVVCKVSPVITNDVLLRMAPYLKNLEYFQLSGCPKVTDKGIRAVLLENTRGIQDMRLIRMSPRLDLDKLLPPSLNQPQITRNLHSLTLTIPPVCLVQGHTPSLGPFLNLIPTTRTDESTVEAFTSPLSRILAHHTPNLEQFQIYSPYLFLEPCPAIRQLFSGLVEAHAGRLKRIGVHRILLGLDVIEEICRQCRVLEDLFIIVESDDFNNLADCIHHAASLRTLHVNCSLEVEADDGEGGPHILSLRDTALPFVIRCDNPCLSQFGFNTRVWHVSRRFVVMSGGEMECKVHLEPYEYPDIPEQFLVINM